MKIFRWKLVFDSQAMLFTALYNMVKELSLFTVQMNFGASFFQKIRVVKAWEQAWSCNKRSRFKFQLKLLHLSLTLEHAWS